MKNYAGNPAGSSDKKEKDAFLEALNAQELKGVAKKAPKKAMRLGKAPKSKANALV